MAAVTGRWPWPGWPSATFRATVLVALVLGSSALAGQGDDDPPLIFGADAGLVLTFVLPDQTDDFERVLGYFREVLEQSEDPIRRQQSEHWRMFRSSDPGPNGAALYVSLMKPVLRGADYNIVHILKDELPEQTATTLIDTLTAALSQPQSTLNLDAILDLALSEAPAP